MELLLVGAQAKVILLENVHGLNAGRATSDIDFAFATENWEQLHQLKQALVNTGRFSDVAKEKQRLLYISDLIEHRFIVDIIPFGPLENADNQILWPPDMDTVMSVSGYQDALDSALLVELDGNIVLKVASLAGLSLLKLFAWSERGTSTDYKDAQDFMTILRAYYDAGNGDRIYDIPENIISSLNYEPDQMGAWLLGDDINAISKSKTVEALISLLDRRKEELNIQMAKSLPGHENAMGIAADLLNSFIRGLKQVCH